MATIARTDSRPRARIPAGIADGVLVLVLTLGIMLLWSTGITTPDLTGPMRLNTPGMPGGPDLVVPIG